ncbi:MAG TPA: glycosyltransferase [Burkholderiaceae bacterium]
MNAPVPLSQITDVATRGTGPITQPYLIVLFNVRFYVDDSGRRWLDALWAKDLIEHTRYIEHLTLAAPLDHGPIPANAVALDQIPALKNLRCIELPAPRNIVTAFWYLPATIAALWRAIASASIVHSSVAGWPLAEAWILRPILLLRPRALYLNVESAFWRIAPGQQASLMRRLRAVISERLNRVCLETSDISTYTHAGYRRSLLRRNADRGHVVEASWIDESDVLDSASAARLLERRSQHAGPLKVVFAGRLTREKGLLVLLEAVKTAWHAGAAVILDVFGEGPLEDECRRQIELMGSDAPVRMRGTMPYGKRFFEELRTYDMLVVPTLSDEQPRIIFDAYAQGLPVLASQTDGLLQCVEENVTGFLFPPGNVRTLSERFVQIAGDPKMLASMVPACVDRARRLTHQQIHRTRHRLLVDRFPELSRAK